MRPRHGRSKRTRPRKLAGLESGVKTPPQGVFRVSRTKSRRRELQQNLERLRARMDASPHSISRSRNVVGEDFGPYHEFHPAAETREMEELRREVKALRRLQEIIHFLQSASDLDSLFAEIIDLGLGISGLSRGMLALRPPGTAPRSASIRVVRGYTRDERHSKDFRFGRTLLSRAIERGRSLICHELASDRRYAGYAQLVRVRSVVLLPLEAGGHILGALCLDGAEGRPPFTQSEEDLLRSFARHAAVAVEGKLEQQALKEQSDRLRRGRQELARRLAHQEQEIRNLRCGGKGEADFDRAFESAQRRFVVRYLRDVMRRCNNDLEAAARKSRLSVSRLVKLLERYRVLPA